MAGHIHSININTIGTFDDQGHIKFPLCASAGCAADAHLLIFISLDHFQANQWMLDPRFSALPFENLKIDQLFLRNHNAVIVCIDKVAR